MLDVSGMENFSHLSRLEDGRVKAKRAEEAVRLSGTMSQRTRTCAQSSTQLRGCVNSEARSLSLRR
jgi:hypothetical protein